ncbi:MAG: MFS transporter, partial [Verrucomicrobiales bacterium]|nr:MFS transporter [Verrucomicrobiales bacterium]
MRAQGPLIAGRQAAPAPTPHRWPRQIWFILGNETAERFSFYGMKGILALYITNVLLMTRDDATRIIHLFGFANYFMPLFGAWVSDRYWGRYHTILWISLSYCLGHGIMALSDAVPTLDGKVLCLYAGLGLIAFGSGGIKPCVSAFMGDQFGPDQRHLLPKAYAAFYWCINLGSTASFLIIPWIRKNYGYSWAFGVPGLAMALATFVFWLGTKHYVMVPPTRKTRTAGFFRVLLHAYRHRHERRPGQSFWDPARARFSDAEVDAAASVGP